MDKGRKFSGDVVFRIGGHGHFDELRGVARHRAAPGGGVIAVIGVYLTDSSAPELPLKTAALQIVDEAVVVNIFSSAFNRCSQSTI